MADVPQAAKWMQEGKRVITRNSNRCLSVYMDKESEIFYTHPGGVRTQFTIEDLLAVDWKIDE